MKLWGFRIERKGSGLVDTWLQNVKRNVVMITPKDMGDAAARLINFEIDAG